MGHGDFETIVEEALASLPEEFSRKLENVEVVIEEEPSDETLKRLGLPHGGLLGLYHGVPLKRKSIWASGALPGKISIYRIPILAVSRTEQQARERIRDVVIHEVGHHFGLSDSEMNQSEGRPSGNRRPPEGKRRPVRRERKE